MDLIRWFAPAFASLVDLLAPPTCAACSVHVGLDEQSTWRPSLCSGCRLAIVRCDRPWCPRCGVPGTVDPAGCSHCPEDPSFRSVVAYGVFESTSWSGSGPEPMERGLRQQIHAMKFGKNRGLAIALGTLLADLAGVELPLDRYEAVVPVPLHASRLASRGFNQSYLLARQVARRHGVPLVSALVRDRTTSAQARLANDLRRANLEDAIVRQPGIRWAEGTQLLLVDDVVTTGWTASACARALRDQGATSVDVLCLARTPLQRHLDRAAYTSGSTGPLSDQP